MKRRTGKIPTATLVAVTIVTIVLMTIVLSVKIRTEAPFYSDKIAASEHTARAFKVIRTKMDSLRIPIDPVNDPNRTGLIGLQFSLITTERADLQSKLTATNPNTAAMIVQLLKKAGIHRHDTVAVYMTGSTPALNIATVIALETVGATPIIVTAVASAMWGANYPGLTMLDIEHTLRDAGIITSRTIAATIGGHDETGRGLSPEGRALIDSSTIRNQIPLLAIHDVKEAVDLILAAFGHNTTIKTFITISEQPNALSGYDIPPGIIPAYSIKQGSGLIPYFSQKGVTVINLTQVNHLAQRYGLPIAPIPLPDTGEGILYHEHRYSVVLATIFLFLLIAVLFFLLRYDIMPKRSNT
ncbi:poly-gamma-glutamate system protein [candidate division WOR-3 bacterium]|nr:poly-gamma-glutamate system protein [candidate division WOR-3 bacterium]